jgi:hypothetical protein
MAPPSGGLHGWIRNSKDAGLALALRTLLNSRVEAFGEIRDVSVDSANRRIRLRVALRGETEPVDLDIRGYELERTGDGDWLTVVAAEASREWLTAALQQFVVGRRFRIPAQAAGALRLLI